VATRVAILRAGFAAKNVARHLTRFARRAEINMTIVYRDTYMFFTPMLPYASSGPIKPRKIAPPLFAILP